MTAKWKQMEWLQAEELLLLNKPLEPPVSHWKYRVNAKCSVLQVGQLKCIVKPKLKRVLWGVSPYLNRRPEGRGCCMMHRL